MAKFYVGYILRSPNLDPTDRHIVILPLASGYGHPENLRFTFTTNYLPAYKTGRLDENDFLIVLPISSIKSVNMFDQAVYDSTFASLSSAKNGEEPTS